MRRAAVMAVALFLVNLPFAHQVLTERKVRAEGREVTAQVVASRSVDGRHLVEYTLPKSVDPDGTRHSARVDEETFAAAVAGGTLAVLVVPGDPAANRPLGAVPSRVFAAVAIATDVLLVLGGVLYWRRRRRWLLHEVVEVREDEVTLRYDGRTLIATAPDAWLLRARPGHRVPGSLHLVAEVDLLPGPPGLGLEQVHGATYRAEGQVVDARRHEVVLDVGGLMLTVDPGPHRVRADIRDTTAVTGTLCFTPS